jgi:hypothetical protein
MRCIFRGLDAAEAAIIKMKLTTTKSLIRYFKNMVPLMANRKVYCSEQLAVTANARPHARKNDPAGRLLRLIAE